MPLKGHKTIWEHRRNNKFWTCIWFLTKNTTRREICGLYFCTFLILLVLDWNCTYNRPFSSCCEPHYESEAKCKAFHMKNSFFSIWMKTNFHNNIMRFKATRKWPILFILSLCFQELVTDIFMLSLNFADYCLSDLHVLMSVFSKPSGFLPFNRLFPSLGIN